MLWVRSFFLTCLWQNDVRIGWLKWRVDCVGEKQPFLETRLLPMKISRFVFSILFAAMGTVMARAAESGAATYPLKTCVVSGESLGSMGKPFVYEYEGREVRFCCKSCLKDFNKNPKQFSKKIEEAAAKGK